MKRQLNKVCDESVYKYFPLVSYNNGDQSTQFSQNGGGSGGGGGGGGGGAPSGGGGGAAGGAVGATELSAAGTPVADPSETQQ